MLVFSISHLKKQMCQVVGGICPAEGAENSTKMFWNHQVQYLMLKSEWAPTPNLISRQRLEILMATLPVNNPQVECFDPLKHILSKTNPFFCRVCVSQMYTPLKDQHAPFKNGGVSTMILLLFLNWVFFYLPACLGGYKSGTSFISNTQTTSPKPIEGAKEPEAAGELLRPPKSTFMMSRFMASHLSK